MHGMYLYMYCCSVLQCVAVCCSVLQCVAVCCSVHTLKCMYLYMHCAYTRVRTRMHPYIHTHTLSDTLTTNALNNSSNFGVLVGHESYEHQRKNNVGEGS